MKVIIAGSRSITDYRVVEEAVKESGFLITEEVTGKASGVDNCGEQWADTHGVPNKDFPAKWKDTTSPTYNPKRRYDPVAGYRRNEEMARYADALIAVWDGQSKGTADMIERAKAHKLRIYIKKV